MPNSVGLGRFLVGAVVSLAFANTSYAQIPLTPGALGMGGAYTASARGFESIFFNPANLGLPGTPAWSVAFPQVTAGASVLGPDVTDLPDFLNYDNLTVERRQELLAMIPARGTSVDLDVRAPLAAIQVGNVGIGVSYGAMAEHTLGKDLVELFFQGYEPGRYDYQVGNTRGERVTFWDIAVGYGRAVGAVSLGATGHYYIGRSLVQTRAFEPRYDFLLGRNIEVDYVGVGSKGGRGFGLDVGAAVSPLPGLTVSAAVANVVSTMEWSEELVGRSVTLSNADFEDGEVMLLEDRYQQSERDIGDTPTGQFAQVATGLFEDRDFPTTLRLGAAYSPIRQIEIGGAYQRRLGEGRLLGNWEQLLGVGIQARIPLVTLRAGASTSLDGGSILGAGLRLGVLDVGVARYRTPGTLDDDADRDGLAASFSINVRTRAVR